MFCENPRLDQWLRKNLVCPRDFKSLEENSVTLFCSEGHSYPIIAGVPILLLKEVTPTQKKFWETSFQPIKDKAPAQNGLDPFVQKAIPATSGNLYRLLKLNRYPIPELPLPKGEGSFFLDLGCNWGRWCLSAAQKGYLPIGIDPNLEAVLAARRIAKQLGHSACFLVADARHLPFAPSCTDIVFSYSVLQHFEKSDVHRVLQEISRILKPGGASLIEMPNVFGLHNLLHQLKRGFRKARDFEVRYWTPAELKKTFGFQIGSTRLFADGYFSLNPQAADLELLPFGYRFIVKTSEFLRKSSLRWRWMTYGADSLYVRSSPAGSGEPAKISPMDRKTS